MSEQPLSKLLRESTASVHALAEFGWLNEQSRLGENLQGLAAAHYFIYSSLEQQLLKHKDEPRVQKIYFPELFRLQSIKDDLKHFFPNGYEGQIYPKVGVCLFMHRITNISKSAPYLLIAHAYVRYMGDLSGGQMIKESLKKALGSEAGLSFYEFKEISDPTAFKNGFRAALDDMQLSVDEKNELAKEAKLSFLMNIAMLKEIGEQKAAVNENEGRILLQCAAELTS